MRKITNKLINIFFIKCLWTYTFYTITNKFFVTTHLNERLSHHTNQQLQREHNNFNFSKILIKKTSFVTQATIFLSCISKASVKKLSINPLSKIIKLHQKMFFYLLRIHIKFIKKITYRISYNF